MLTKIITNDLPNQASPKLSQGCLLFKSIMADQEVAKYTNEVQ